MRVILLSMEAFRNRLLACACALIMTPIGTFTSFCNEAALPTFPVVQYNTPQETQWTPPEPEERPLLAELPDGSKGRIIQYGAWAGVAGGAIFFAGGVARLAESASRPSDSEGVHDGALMMVAGGLFTAVFSIIARAARGPTP